MFDIHIICRMNKRFRKQKGKSKIDKSETQATLDSKTQNEDMKNKKNKRITKMRKDSKIIILNSIAK